MKEKELSVVNTMNEGDKLRLVLSDGSSALLPFNKMPVATVESNGLMSSSSSLKERNRIILYSTKPEDQGFLCRTNISRSSNSMFILKVTVNNYDSYTPPSLIIVQGYMYNTGILSVSSSVLGTSVRFYLLEIDNTLYFYFPKYRQFMTYYIELICNVYSRYITYYQTSEKPLNATKEIVIE